MYLSHLCIAASHSFLQGGMHHISHREKKPKYLMLFHCYNFEVDLNWNRFVCPISGFQFVFLKKKHYRRRHKKKMQLSESAEMLTFIISIVVNSARES